MAAYVPINLSLLNMDTRAGSVVMRMNLTLTVMPLCACGCGLRTAGGKFRQGHHGRTKSAEFRRSIAANAARCKHGTSQPTRRRSPSNPEATAAYNLTHKQKNVEIRRALKREVIEAYGGQCVCCGEKVLDFLCLDHVDDDGASHRRELHGGESKHRGAGGVFLYKWAKQNSYPKSLQVLCHNHNIKKEKARVKSDSNGAKVWKRERLKAIAAYGGKCACCGNPDADILHLDHVNDDGNRHREAVGSKIVRWAMRNNFPTSLQLLCPNCNFSKHLNKGTCAHAIPTD